MKEELLGIDQSMPYYDWHLEAGVLQPIGPSKERQQRMVRHDMEQIMRDPRFARCSVKFSIDIDKDGAATIKGTVKGPMEAATELMRRLSTLADEKEGKA